MWFSKKEKKIPEKKAPVISPWREYPEMIVEVLVFVFFINTFLLQSQAIPTPSMVKTMLIGDHLLVNKVAYAPYINNWEKKLLPIEDIQRGMIVTFKSPAEMDKDYVKRVIGLPGDRIQVRDKIVYINGVPQVEPYTYYEGEPVPTHGDNFPLNRPRIIDALGHISYLPFYMNAPGGGIDQERTIEVCERFKDAITQEKDGSYSFTVPRDYYFCMGDNRDNSYDSRFWGPVPRAYIIGKPWRNYWSYESVTADYLTDGFFNKLKDLALTAVRFFSHTRWNRTFLKFE